MNHGCRTMRLQHFPSEKPRIGHGQSDYPLAALMATTNMKKNENQEQQQKNTGQ
jgi:hypothetical protein